MPDELYTRKWDDENRMVGKYRYTAAGFTLADVRRLVKALHARKGHPQHYHEELAPFAALLKEKPDAT